MNLKGFKKVHDNESEAILKNDKGHEIRIAKKALTSKHLKDLNNLPIHASDGTMTSSQEDDPEDPFNKAMTSYEQSGPHSTKEVADEGRRSYIEGNKDELWSMAGGKEGWKTAQDRAEEAKTKESPPAEMTPGPMSMPGDEPTQETPASQPLARSPQSSLAPQQSGGTGDAATDSAMATGNANADGPTAPGSSTGMGALPANPQAVMEQSKQQYIQQHAAQMGEDQAKWNQDQVNGHITPETASSLFASKSTLGKVGTLFGLLLSGAGSGLAHQSNAVMDMMNKELDRDLEAQKNSKSNAMNYYRATQEHELNKANVEGKYLSNEATKIANAKNRMIISMINGTQSGVVNKLPPGPQRAAAQQSLNGVSAVAEQHMQQNNLQAAAALAEDKFKSTQQNLRKAAALGEPGLGALADSNEAHHDSNFGEQVSSRSLTPQDHTTLATGISFDKKLSRFINWTKNHSGDLRPDDIKEGKALAAELQGSYRQATNGGVYKEGEQNFISKIIDEDPTKFFNKIRVLPSLYAVKGEHTEKMRELSHSVGLDYDQAMAGSPIDGGQPQEGATGKVGNRPVIFKNGKWKYQ